MDQGDRIFETVLARAMLGAARPLPSALLQPALNLLVAALRRRHEDAFLRLAELDDSEILIDPVDLPLAFRLGVGGGTVQLRLCGRDDMEAPATVRGRFAHLLDLFEGRIDGDALFFSRDLVIEGDTAVVVALRNAVDGADIDLFSDIAATLGPFAALLTPARHAAAVARNGLSGLHEALLTPANRRLDAMERRLNRLENRGR